MEGQSSSAVATVASARSEVDTSRPFRSVREAVAVFGQRILVGDRDGAYAQKTSAVTAVTKPVYSVPQTPIYSASSTTAKPIYSACSSPPSFSSSSSHFINQDREDDELMILSSLKKLEAELEETKEELKLLKKRESETELALASLNADFHKNMAKLAEMEAAVAGAKAASAKSVSAIEGQLSMMASERWGVDGEASLEYLPSLSAVLRLGEMDDKFGGRKKAKTLKKKPIVPLIGDIFFRKKASADFDNSLYTYSMH